MAYFKCSHGVIIWGQTKMINHIPIKEGYAVFGKGELTYQRVLNDFKRTKFIGIMTFNISSRNSFLLNMLKDACANGTNAVIITNIPKRFRNYFGERYAFAAKEQIDLVIRQLNPKQYAMRLSPYFSFANHAKIIMTDNMVYWGSSNFSDESKNNIECGTISTDRELIKYLRDSLFTTEQKKSIPYYKHNFAEAIANLDGLIEACKTARKKLFEAAFEPWSEYETNFEEKWVYRTNDNDITDQLLIGFIESFNQFEDALNAINIIMEEYAEQDELPEQIERLQDILMEYETTFESFQNTISSLFDDLENMAQFVVPNEASRIIDHEYGMEAYDENLEYYVEVAMDEATSKYEELIRDSEQPIRDSIERLDSMIEYYEQLKDTLHSLLEINPRIDNTGKNLM